LITIKLMGGAKKSFSTDRVTLKESSMTLNELIDMLNEDSSVHGILIQLPLPNHLNEFDIISRILPEKDVDGLTPHSIGLLATGKAVLKPCTPSGIIEMLDYYKILLEAKNVVIINRSNLVGKPLYHLLLQKNATVTTCHSKTKDLKAECKRADIIVVAVGRPKLVKADWVKKDAIVIDVGINKTDSGLVGDVDFDEVSKIAKAITPVPGGGHWTPPRVTRCTAIPRVGRRRGRSARAAA